MLVAQVLILFLMSIAAWYIRVCNLDISREKLLNYLQTMETLIRYHILQCLMWVCTICLSPRLKWVNYQLDLELCHIFVGSFKTKDALREEDIEITGQVQDIERCYREIYQHVHELSESYALCKDHVVFSRYSDLKEMIKACVTEDTLRRVAEYSPARHVEKGKVSQMLQAAKQLTSGTADSIARDGKYTDKSLFEKKMYTAI